MLLQRPLFLALAAAGCLSALTARAQKDAPAPGNVGFAVAVIELPPEEFDRWVFRRQNARATRLELESHLTVRIDDLDRACRLTPAQTQKLRLAGQTDIKRLFDRIEGMRRKFEARRGDREQIQRLFQEIPPLRASISAERVFDDDSLFCRVAQGQLTDEQRPAYERQLAQRREFLRRVQRDIILLSLDRQTPLKADQRTKLEQVLEDLPAVPAGPYQSHALWYVASQIPAAKYQEILEPDQWAPLQARFQSVANTGDWLKQSGALGEDAPKPAGGF